VLKTSAKVLRLNTNAKYWKGATKASNQDSTHDPYRLQPQFISRVYFFDLDLEFTRVQTMIVIAM